MLERIADRRAVLAEQAERLRKELNQVQAELERMPIAERVVAELIGSDSEQPESSHPVPPDTAAEPTTVTQQAVPHHSQSADVMDLPDNYRQIMVAVTAENCPVTCKMLCQQFDLGVQPRHIEGMRTKLKRLVSRGWPTETTPGQFQPTP